MKKRVLSFILAIAMLAGNTISASASSNITMSNHVEEEALFTKTTSTGETSKETTTTEPSSIEETSTEEVSTEVSSAGDGTSTNGTSVEGTSVEESTTEGISVEETTTEATSVEETYVEETSEEETEIEAVRSEEENTNVCSEMYFATISKDGNGNETFARVDTLTLRPEEYKDLQLVMVKDGQTLTYQFSDGNDMTYQDDTIRWGIYSDEAHNTSVDASHIQFVPLDFEREDRIGVAAGENVSAQDTYYLYVSRKVRVEEGKGTYEALIPITIEEAGSDTYAKYTNGTNGVYFSSELLSQAIRNDMVERKAQSTYYVKEDVYQQWKEDGETVAVYDFNREREGMKPYEGDYLYWQNFEINSGEMADQWVFTQVFFRSDAYWKIESKQKYYSTKAEEQKVTETIDHMLKNENGALHSLYAQYYKEDGNYTNAERKAIADACCDYIHSKVTYKGTTEGKYHSAYSAIVNNVGTCQAFSLYLTRLLREFGIANKILTGTDVDYHTYNIVQIDKANDLWYYYDATGGIKYKTEGEFSRTQYQSMFLTDPLFVENYLSKIVGSTYAPSVYLYAGEKLIGKYFTVEAAVDSLKTYNENETAGGKGDTIRYKVVLQKDADVGDKDLILSKSVSYCELDLNGHTLTARNGVVISMDKVRNGTVDVKVAAEQPGFFIYAPYNGNNEIIYEDLSFTFEQANPQFYVSSKVYPDETHKENENAKIYLKNVKLGSCSCAELSGDVYMDEASSIQSTDRLIISNNVGKDRIRLLGKIKTANMMINKGTYDIGDLTVTKTVEIGEDAIVNIWGDTVLGTIQVYGGSLVNERFFNMTQRVDENGTTKSTGSLTLDSGVNFTGDDQELHFMMAKKQITQKSDGTYEEAVPTKFASGETIAIVKKDTASIANKYFRLADAAEDESIVCEGTKLLAAHIALKVSYTDEKKNTTEVSYISLEKAVAGLKTDFGGKQGNYTVSLLESTKLNTNVTFPAFVTGLDWKATPKKEGQECHVDLNGYSIAASAVMTVDDSLQFTNQSGKDSKLSTTAKNGENGYACRIQGTEGKEQACITDVTLAATNGTILFVQTKSGQDQSTIEKETESGATLFNTVASSINAKEVKVESGAWKLGTVGVTNFINNSITHVIKLNNVQNVYNQYGTDKTNTPILIVDQYVQKSNGLTALDQGSCFLITQNAKIYNAKVTASEAGESAHVYRMPDASDKQGASSSCEVSFEGKVSAEKEGCQLSFGVLLTGKDPYDLINAEDREELLLTLKPQTRLFSTGIKTFPTDLFVIEQKQPEEGETYSRIYQQDKEIYAGREWISIYAKQADGTQQTLLESFIRWSDAAAYLDTLSNSQMDYIVKISEDVDLLSALTLPKKVNSITFVGETDGAGKTAQRITLTYTGDIKLNTDTVFENVDLKAVKYDSKTKSYVEYQSTVTLNGKTLTMENVSADFTSVTGNSKSAFIMKGSQVAVTKAVSSLGILKMLGNADEVSIESGKPMPGTVLTADSVTVTDTLTMQSAMIDCTNKVTLKNVASNDSFNVISYGKNNSKNILSLSGSVTADADGTQEEEVMVWREGMGSSQKTWIHKNAIELRIPSLRGDLLDQLLATAPQTTSAWFSVGTVWNDNGTRKSLSYGTYKKNNKDIYCGTVSENVRLYSSGSEAGDYIYESSFVTLQDAFNEIDKLNDSSRYYCIKLVETTENEVTFSTKALTFPSKTAGLLIRGDETQADPCLYFKGSLTLKSNITFRDITFVPEQKCGVTLGKYELELDSCYVDITRSKAGFNAVTGSGVNAGSALILRDTLLHVEGNVSNVGRLVFADSTAKPDTGKENDKSRLRSVDYVPAYPELIADGTVNIGHVDLEKDGYLTGAAAVTRKNGAVTQVASQITINGNVYSENNAVLYLDLTEKISGQYVNLDLDAAEMENITAGGIRMAKALYTTYSQIKAAQDNEGADLIKTGGYLAYYGNAKEAYGVVLSYMDGAETITVNCRSFADAVTEINNKKVKRSYTITLQPAIESISGADQGGSVPTALTMPNKNYADTLTIRSDGDKIKLGFINNITQTCNLVVENVSFTQMLKAGTVYRTADFAKDHYPGALTFNTAGYALTVKGEVTFNTPLTLNGGGKTDLTFSEDAVITTLTNGYEPSEDIAVIESVIYGSLTNMNTVTVDDCNLRLLSFKTAASSSAYTESKNKITTLKVYGTTSGNNDQTVSSGIVRVESALIKAELACTNYISEGATLKVAGKCSLKNATIKEGTDACIHADTNFDITGTFTVNGDHVNLETRLKGVGKEPYLNISGQVIRGNGVQPVMITVYPPGGAADQDSAVDYKTLTKQKGKMQVLAAAKAQSADFALAGANYPGGAYVPGKDGNSNGYMLLKQSGKIYAYNGEQVKVAVYKGEDTLVGYYPSLKDASADVDAIRDKTKAYTFVLTENNGAMTSPVSVVLPTQAESVTVKKLSSEADGTVYVSGNITLKCDTVFEDICFAPANNKGEGTAFSITTGAYDLTLQGVTVDDKKGMALKDISGNGKNMVVLDSDNLILTGSVNNVAELTVKAQTQINTNVKSTSLVLEDTLTVNGTITVDDLYNAGDSHTLNFARSKDNKSPVLTVNKTITSEDDAKPVILRMQDSYSVKALTKTGGKVTVNNASKVMTLPKGFTDRFILQAKVVTADNREISYEWRTDAYGQKDTGSDLTLVKADKGIYIADETLSGDIVLLSDTTNGKNSYCLDYSQAVTEINTLAAADCSYEIIFEALKTEGSSTEGSSTEGSSTEGSSVADTNTKDAVLYGTFPMPKANTFDGLLIKGDGTGKTTVAFTGAVSISGRVALQDLLLRPLKNGKELTAADTKITLSKDKKGSELTLTNVSLHESLDTLAQNTKAAGFITSISGTKNVSQICLTGCDPILVKSGITNVDTVTMKDSALITDGSVTVNTVKLEDTSSSWDGLGKMTFTDVYVKTGVSEAYIGTKQDKQGHPGLTINGEIKTTDPEGTPYLLCKVYKEDTTFADVKEILDGTCTKEVSTYAGTELASAKTARADHFRAYAFRLADADGTIQENAENITKENLAAYKEGTYVKNDDLSTMQIKLTEYRAAEDGSRKEESISYAKCLEDAVTTINNRGDGNACYEILFLTPEVIMTAKKGTAYGTLTLPGKAAEVTITGYGENPCTWIKYTGGLKVNCNLTFKNILLTEGKADNKVKGGFAESGCITPTLAKNATLTLTEQVYTEENGQLKLGTVNASTGNLVIKQNAAVGENTVSLNTLTLLNGATLHVKGKATIKELLADASAGNKLLAESTVSITDMGNAGKMGTAKAEIRTDFTKVNKAGTYGNTQLTIVGEITDMDVTLSYRRYDPDLKTYLDMGREDFAKLLVTDPKKPQAYQKLAVLTKASLERICVDAQGLLYKHESGLYLTESEPLVRVTGYMIPDGVAGADPDTDPYTEENKCYETEFLTWEQAVKEIDKIGNTSRYYEICLLDTVGYDKTLQNVSDPVGTLTMPTKAREVRICSENEETNGIFFTGTTVALKCPVRMENMGLVCVKKTVKSGVVTYPPVTFTINIANQKLTRKDICDTVESVTAQPCTVSGSSKGILCLEAGEKTDEQTKEKQCFAAIKGMDELQILRDTAGSENGSDAFVIDCSGEVNVKDLTIQNSTLEAKNITVSQCADLAKASLLAGTEAKNDGKITIKDIVLEEGKNRLTAEQSSSGLSQITISGTVKTADKIRQKEAEESVLEILLYYNTYKKGNTSQVPVQMYDGMVLCNAPKADTDFFAPVYTKDGSKGMGIKIEGYGVYRSGKNICHGTGR